MEVKIVEIRDRGTFFPVVCVNMNPINEAQRYLLRRVGYPCDGQPNVAISKASADGDGFCNDPYHWGGRTMPVAHNHIIEHWGEIVDGEVIDVEFILGESTDKKISERFSVHI